MKRNLERKTAGPDGLRGYLKEVGGLFRSWRYLLPVLLATVGSYAYILFHPTLAIDNTGEVFYFLDYGLLAQGRFSQVFLYKLMGLPSNHWFTPVLGVATLFVASFFWAGLYAWASRGRLTDRSLWLFGALFVSYPLMAETFVYDILFFYVALAYILVPVALVMARKAAGGKLPWALPAVALLAFTVPLYESFAAVFLFGIFSLLAAERWFAEERKTWGEELRLVVGQGVVLALGVGAALGIGALIKIGIPPTVNYADSSILWLKGNVLSTAGKLLSSFVYEYVLNALAYLPVFLAMAAILLQVVLMIRKKDGVLAALLSGAVLSNFAIAILSGHLQFYRSCSSFAPFTAFTFLLVLSRFLPEGTASKAGEGRAFRKRAALVLAGVLVLWQVWDLNYWFRAEVARDVEEKQVAERIAGELNRYGYVKPVVFIGEYDFSLSLKMRIWAHTDSLAGLVHDRLGHGAKDPENGLSYLIVQSSVTSVFNGTIGVYYRNVAGSDTHSYFSYLGYHLTPDWEALYKPALAQAVPGRLITETPEMLIVDLTAVNGAPVK